MRHTTKPFELDVLNRTLTVCFQDDDGERRVKMQFDDESWERLKREINTEYDPTNPPDLGIHVSEEINIQENIGG